MIDSCQKNGKSVMATVEVTDKTYKMAEFLEKKWNKKYIYKNLRIS